MESPRHRGGYCGPGNRGLGRKSRSSSTPAKKQDGEDPTTRLVLKPDFRTVFVLRDIEELSIRRPPRTLGISVPAVKSRLLRARLQLREKLTRFFRRKGDDVFAYL